MRRLILVSTVVLPVAVFAQQDDRGYLTALLEDNLSGAGRSVVITGFEGALSSQARIAQLTIADDQGVWISLRDVTLDWNRAALLRGDVVVNALTAAEIVLERMPVSEAAAPSPEAVPFSLPELPVSVNIGTLAAERIVLGESVLGTALEGRVEATAALAGGQGDVSLVLERTDDGPEGRLALSAGYANASRQLRIDLDAREAAGGIAAGLLDLPGAPSVELSIKGDAPISDFQVDVRLRSDNEDRLAGKITLQEDADEGQRFAANLGGDLAPLFLPEYADFFGDDIRLITEGVRHADGRLDLSRLGLETRALSLAGNLLMSGDGLPERFDLSGQLGAPDGLPVLLPLTTEVRTSLRRADLSLAYDRQRGEGWKLQLVADDLTRDDVEIDRLQLEGSGRINRVQGAPVFGATLRYEAQGLRPTDPALASLIGSPVEGTAILHWTQAKESLNISRMTLSSPGYQMTAGGRLQALSQGLDITGWLEARMDDLARATPIAGRPMSGAGAITLKGKGNLLSGSFDVDATLAGQDLTIGQAEVDNLLRGASQISASVRRDETGTTLRALDVAAQSLRATASGTIATAGSNLSADLDFGDLSVLGGPYRGALSGQAQLTGTTEDAVVTLLAKGTGLAIGQAEADRLLAGPSTIDLEAGIQGSRIDLRRLGVRAATLSVDAKGVLHPDASDLAADLVFSDLSVLGSGWRGRLSARAEASGTPDAGKLSLKGVGDALAIGQAEVDTMLRGRSELDLSATLDGTRIRIDRATLSNPQLSAQATGGIEGNVRKVDLSARLSDMGLILPEFPGPLTVTGTAEENASGYRLNLQGKGPGGIDARVSGTVAPGFRSADLAISGSGQAGLVNPFIDPRSLSGGLGFDLRLNGPLALSSLNGRLSLTNGRLADPLLPFGLQAIEAVANLANGRAQIVASTALTTRGTIRVTGGVGLVAPFDADLTAELQQVVARDPDLFETRLNGQVTFRGPATGGAVIGGNIVLNETELRVPSTGLTGAAMIDGLIHVNEPAAVNTTRRYAGLIAQMTGGPAVGPRRPYPLALTIGAPNRVFIRGRGLDAELGGELQLGGTTDDIVPSGGFQLIRGRLDILGKRLNLSEATMRLEGDFDPWLRILASNESDGITSSVLIEGRATDPKISFVSSPELPEEEVLSRLLFGRDLTSLSALQAVELAGAVATLAGRGGEGIVSKLRKGIGLDNLDFSSDAAGNSSVKAGKYLSRNLYTEVEVDQAGQSQIFLNLDVTEDIKLRGAVGSDGQTSLGIFLEKDY
jgi:translocation and assembly module TamB